MKILYLGDSAPSSTSCHRAAALRRLGHTVQHVDISRQLKTQLAGVIYNKVHFRTGYRLLQPRIRKLIASAQFERPDLIWINSGELFGPGCLKELRKLQCPVILYNNDDATGTRDGRRFDSLRQAIPFYDLCCVKNVPEYYAAGAKDAIRIFMSYDEVAHAPLDEQEAVSSDFNSDVAFIGTWMRGENRDRFLLDISKSGVSIAIWGDRWQKSRCWRELQSMHRGGAVAGKSYVAAIARAKLCIGLLSRGNRDLHTRRSLEVPYAGGLLCAERTSEHMEMYADGKEAVFWSSTDECVQQCKALLANPELRERIRLAGMKRVRELGVGNEDICRKILEHVVNRSPAHKVGIPVI